VNLKANFGNQEITSKVQGLKPGVLSSAMGQLDSTCTAPP
jgi:hypothetical protein